MNVSYPQKKLGTERKGRKKRTLGASLIIQWLRINLPMQRTWVRSLVQEDPTCCGAMNPTRPASCACALEPTLCNKRSHGNEKHAHCNSRADPARRN